MDIDGSPPKLGLYTFTISSGSATGSDTDFYYIERDIPTPDINTFSPANGSTVDSKTPSFTWEAVDYSEDIALYYRLEIRDASSENRVFATGRVYDPKYYTLPEGILEAGKTYTWRVRVSDSDNWEYVQNRVNSDWVTFTVANTLAPHSYKPAIELTVWGVLTWSYGNKTATENWLRVIDHDGVAGDGSSHQISVTFPDESVHWMNFIRSDAPNMGSYEFFVGGIYPQSGNYTFTVVDPDGNTNTVVESLNSAPLEPPDNNSLTPSNKNPVSENITATYDNIFVNGSLYENFDSYTSIEDIDYSKWRPWHSNASIEDGKLVLSVNDVVGRGHGSLDFTYPETITSIKADITVSSISVLDGPPKAEIKGTWCSNGRADINGGISITGNRVYYSVSEDFIINRKKHFMWNSLASDDLMTVTPGQTVTVEISLSGNTLAFTANGNTKYYTIPGDIYPAREFDSWKSLRTRINLVTDTTPTFSWDPVTNANRYRVKIYNWDRNSVAADRYPGNVTSYTFPPGILSPNGYFNYRFEAWDAPNPLNVDNVSKTPASSDDNYRFYTGSEEAVDPFMDPDNFGVHTWNQPVTGPQLSFWVKVHDAQGVPKNIKSVKVTHPSGAITYLDSWCSNPYSPSTSTYCPYNSDSDLPLESGNYTFTVEDMEEHVVSITENLDVNVIGYPAVATLIPAEGTELNSTAVNFDWEDVFERAFYSIDIFDYDYNRVYTFHTTESKFDLPEGFLKDKTLYRWRVKTRREYYSENVDNSSSSPDYWNMLTFTTSALTDDDTDGIPDDWENKHGVDGPNDDPDNDGLTNKQEYDNATDPNNPDSDGDGLPDGWEKDNGLNPLSNDAAGDADSDGVINLHEFQGGTDPQSSMSFPDQSQLSVDPANGDDFNIGNGDYPLQTLHGAVERINSLPEANYTINLTPGIYSRPLEADTALAPVHNITINGAGATIDGSGATAWTNGLIIAPGVTNVTIRNLTIQYFEYAILANIDGGCITLDAITVTQCETGLKVVDTYQATIDLTGSNIFNNQIGLHMTSGSSNNVIRNGLVTNNTDGILLESDGETPDDNRFEGIDVTTNAGNGIVIYEGSGNVVFNCRIIGNNTGRTAYGGIAVYAGCNEIVDSVIEQNNCYGVYADDALASQPLMAVNNDWGASSGPQHPEQNPAGSGNAVSDHVVFMPWTGFVPAGDDDNDGWPAQAEAQAGTDPNDGADYPTMTQFTVGGAGADDNNLGDAGRPLKTLHGAIARINGLPEADYRIEIGAGIYDLGLEADQPLAPVNRVTIVGENAVIDGDGASSWTEGFTIPAGAAYLRIEGVLIKNFKTGIAINSEGGCVNLVAVTLDACETGLKLVDSYQVEVDLHDAVITGCTNGIEIAAGSSNNVIRSGTVSDNSGAGIVVDAGSEAPSDNTITGVDVLNNAKTGIILRGGDGNLVTDCLISGNNSGREGYGAIAVLTCCSTITWNTMENNQCAGVYADEASLLEIHGNLIRNNRDGIRLAYTSGVTVENNTITENIDGLVIEDGSSPDIVGNILWNNGLGTDLVVSGEYKRMEFNNVGTTNLLSMPADNISQDPKFKNASAGDYTLDETSPCIDGVDNVVEGRDCYGEYRPLGNSWDMGAFESPGYADQDDDDLPDWWEQRIVDADDDDGIDDIEDVTRDGDFDGDGVSNWNEWLNGTNPTTRISVSITQPEDNPAVTALATIDLAGESESASSMRLEVNGIELIDAITIDEGGTWTAAGVPLNPGQNLIVVIAEGADNPATASVTIIRDAETPAVTIIDPVSEGEYPTSAETISASGVASDDTGVTSVTWLREVAGVPNLTGEAVGTESWDTGQIPLIKDAEENTINTITITAEDDFDGKASVSIVFRQEPTALVEENVPLDDDETDPDIDEQDFDGDKYLNEDESACLGEDSPAPNDPAITPPNYADSSYPTDPSHPDYDETKVGYKWPDCLNTDDDNDGLLDDCEIVFGSSTSDQGPGDDFDTDGVSNLQECIDGTDLRQAPATDFQLTITDLSDSKGYNDWLPGFGRVLKIEAKMVGDQAPATALFSLQSTSSYPGRAVNDPDKTLVAIDRYPDWYEFNGFDFGLTATDPTTDSNVHSIEQGPVTTSGRVIATDPTEVVYEIYLQSWDFGGRTMLVVTHPTNTGIRSEIWVPRGSGANGISSAWEYDNDPTYRLDANADIDKITFDETMDKYPAPLGDDFNNFEEYRGIVYYPAVEMINPPEARVLKHQRLNPHHKDLFVRAERFDDAIGDPYRPFTPPVEDGKPQWSNYDPFRLGPAFKNAGIDVHNTTGWGHDVTEDYTFFTYYRKGNIADIKGAVVKGIDTQWVQTWPLYEWEFKLDIDPGDDAPAPEQNRWMPVVLWEDPFTQAPETLVLAFKYKEEDPIDLGTGQYAIRMPLPHINVLIVRHDHKLQGVYSTDTGFIRFISATPPDNLDPAGSRHWSWATKGLGISNAKDGNYGIALTLKTPLDHFFGDKPYMKGTVWDADAGVWRDAQGNEVTALAPLSRCEDQADQMMPVDGIMVGDTENGVWDGDRRMSTYTEWAEDGQLSPFDVDGDGFIELPFVSDPVKADPGTLNPDFEYTRAHVLMHTTTHEVAHSIGVASHTDVDICLMYRYSNNYNRANYLSNWFRSMLRINNKVR